MALTLPITLDFAADTWTDANGSGPLSDLVGAPDFDADLGATVRLATGELAALLLPGTPLTWVVDFSSPPTVFAVSAPILFKPDFSAFADFYVDIGSSGWRFHDQATCDVNGFGAFSTGPH